MSSKQLNFFTSIISDHTNVHTTWRRYAKQIFNICDSLEPNHGLYTNIVCPYHEIFDKKTFKITDILNLAKTITTKLVLINSDIELLVNDQLWEKIIQYSDDGLIIGHRFNYEKNYDDGILNENGIDFFIINTDILLPNDHLFSLGLCGWDWWIPYVAMKNNIPIYRINKPFLYHKKHDRKWNTQSYHYMMNHFYKITGYNSHTYKKTIINYSTDL